MTPSLSPEFTAESPMTLPGTENLAGNGPQIIQNPQILDKSGSDLAAEDEGIGLDHSEETTSGWLFGPLAELPSYFTDASELWTSRSVENININFAAAIKEQRANGRGNSASSSTRQYNLRPRASRDDSGFGSASEEPSIKYESIDPAKSPSLSSTRSKRTGKLRESSKGSHTEISFSQRLAMILPMETRDRLCEKPKKCVATTKEIRQCKNNARRSQEVLKTFSMPTIDPALKPFLELVQVLIACTLCTQHWKKADAEFEIIVRTHLNGMSKDDSAVFDNWIRALAKESRSISKDSASQSADLDAPAMKLGAADTTQDKSRRPRAASVERVMYSDRLTRKKEKELIGVDGIVESQPRGRVLRSGTKDYIQKLESYQPGWQKKLTVSQALYKLMNEALSETELKPGFIYMYWFPPNFGQIKIGYTAATVENRKHEWEVKCKHPVADVGPDPNFLKRVRYARRVERLIHAELKDVRLRETGCRGCGGIHDEWFREMVGHAEKVLEKWAAWMEEMPYVHVEGEKKSGWVLKKDISKDRIQELCKPVETLMPRKRHSMCELKSSKSAGVSRR